MKESRGVMGETGGDIFMYQAWKDQPKSEGENVNVLNECSALACLWSLPAPSPSYWRFKTQWLILITADATVGEKKDLVSEEDFLTRTVQQLIGAVWQQLETQGTTSAHKKIFHPQGAFI